MAAEENLNPTMINIPMKWEPVTASRMKFMAPYQKTHRAKVVGGWLLRHIYHGPRGQSAHAIVFLPDPEHGWQISEQRIEWELIESRKTPNDDKKTFRLEFPGGWALMDGFYDRKHLSMAMTYVPDEGHVWTV